MKDLITLDEIKTRFYGKRGSKERNRIESETAALRIGLQIREARQKQNLTQAQLAEKINKKRSFISKVENDGSNITLQTLIDIVQQGLGKNLIVTLK